jgi:hypothetical protein
MTSTYMQCILHMTHIQYAYTFSYIHIPMYVVMCN